MSDLAIVCACGHKACYHPDQAQQAAYSAFTEGRYAKECKGGLADGGMRACRCITSREEVIANPRPTVPATEQEGR